MTNSTDSPKSNSLFSSKLFYVALLLVVAGVLYFVCRGIEQTVQTRTQYIQLQRQDRQVKEIQFKYRSVYHKGVQQDAQIVASGQVITDLLKAVDSLQTALNRKLNTKPRIYTRVSQRISLPPMMIPFTDTTQYTMTDSLADYLADHPTAYVLVPKSFQKDSSLFYIQGQVHNNGITIDSLVIPNEVSVQVGYQRKHFLAPYRTVVTAINSSPLVKSTLSNSLVAQTPFSRLHLGLQAGYGIQLNTFKPGPYVGVGITYQPF